jgi:hypothetical protein
VFPSRLLILLLCEYLLSLQDEECQTILEAEQKQMVWAEQEQKKQKIFFVIHKRFPSFPFVSKFLVLQACASESFLPSMGRAQMEIFQPVVSVLHATVKMAFF